MVIAVCIRRFRESWWYLGQKGKKSGSEGCRVLHSCFSSPSPKSSSFVQLFPSPLNTTTTTTSINAQDASNTLFHRLTLNIKSLWAFIVAGATVLVLENTESSSSGQFGATLSSFKSIAGHLVLLRDWEKLCCSAPWSTMLERSKNCCFFVVIYFPVAKQSIYVKFLQN